MYLPLIILLIFVAFWLLRRFGIIPAKLKCCATKEQNEENVKNKVKQKKKCGDEDLFSRAAELNYLPRNAGSNDTEGLNVDTSTIVTATIKSEQ